MRAGNGSERVLSKAILDSHIQHLAKWTQETGVAGAGSDGAAHTTETITGECACICSCMYVYVFVQLGDLFLCMLACVCAQATRCMRFRGNARCMRFRGNAT